MEGNNSNMDFSKKRISNWAKGAKYRKANKKWLRYSSEISRRIYALIEKDKQLSQVKIAAALDVSPQYINKILKGRENLTLETIGKLSDVLEFELISFPEYKYNRNDNSYIATATTTPQIFFNINFSNKENKEISLEHLADVDKTEQNKIELQVA